MLPNIFYVNFLLQNFLSILSREPDNVQANHNLCVVYVEQNKLREAESCLQKTIQLAPTETYIQKHLAIVQNRIQQVQVSKGTYRLVRERTG